MINLLIISAKLIIFIIMLFKFNAEFILFFLIYNLHLVIIWQLEHFRFLQINFC